MNGIQDNLKSESVQDANLPGGISPKERERRRRNSFNWAHKNKERSKEIKQKYLKNNKWRRKISVLVADIKYRCDNPNSPKYKFYGEKGIKNFLDAKDVIFLWNRDNADLLKRASIDRIDSNGNYTLENCRFIEFYDNAMEGLRKTKTHQKTA